MDPITLGALITGGATIGAAGASVFGGAKANTANREIVREQMAFQERMSSTAIQRAMLDARNARVNPYYVLKGGGSASTPTGAGAVMQNTMSGAVSTAIELRRINAEINAIEVANRKVESDIDLNKAQVRVLNKDAQYKDASTKNIQANQNVNRYGIFSPIVTGVKDVKDYATKNLPSWYHRQIDKVLGYYKK